MKQSYSIEQKQYHVTTWRQSGLTKTVYCAQHGIAFSTFKSWCSLDSATKLFIPVVVNTHATVDQPIIAHFPNGVQITIPAQQIVQVLQALLPC